MQANRPTTTMGSRLTKALSKISQQQTVRDKDQNEKQPHFCQILLTGTLKEKPIHAGISLKKFKTSLNKHSFSSFEPSVETANLNINTKGWQTKKATRLKKKLWENTAKQNTSEGRMTWRRKRSTLGRINIKRQPSFIQQQSRAKRKQDVALPSRFGSHCFWEGISQDRSTFAKANHAKSAQIIRAAGNCNQESASLDDSIQYIYEQLPGPAYYANTGHLIKDHQGTFARDFRFEKIRPATAEICYAPSNTASLNRNNELQTVSFGTSKSNLRSQIKKVEYCDWIRPHCYQGIKDMNTKIEKETFYFASSKQRFSNGKPKYLGPDFYDSQKVQHKSPLPAYYFLSDVQKGLNFPQSACKENINQITNNGHKTKTKARAKSRQRKSVDRSKWKQTIQKQGKPEIMQELQIETPKNTLGQRSRKPRTAGLSRTGKSQVKNKLLSHQDQNIWSQTEQFNAIRSINMSATHSKIMENKWIKPSFNTRFQSKPAIFRA